MPNKKEYIVSDDQEKSISKQLHDEIKKIKDLWSGYKKINDELKKESSNAPGLGKIFNDLWKQMTKAMRDMAKNFLLGKKGVKKSSKSTNPLDLGLLYLVGLLASIDLCSIIQTIQNFANKIKGKGFDPNADPPPNDPLWKIQKKAYDIQVIIDAFDVAFAISADPSAEISNLLRKVIPELNKLNGPDYLGDQTIKETFPQVSNFNNYIEDVTTKFADNFKISNTDKQNIDNFRKKITFVRQICVLVQGLSSPASLISFATHALPPETYNAIDKLGVDNINAKDISKIVAQIASALRPISGMLKMIVKMIKSIQSLVRILLILVKIFRIILNFLLILPLPNLYTTLGITTKTTDTFKKLQKYSDTTIKILNSVNKIIVIILSLLEGISAALDQLLDNLIKIVNNLKSCTRNDQDPVLRSIEDEIKNIQDSNNEIKAFVANYNNKKVAANNSYYGYTIQILTEQIADPAVQKLTIPRRYGIALNSDGIAVVESTPTFASDDNIIKSEVKLLLLEKNLIKNPSSSFSAADLAIIAESMLILGDNSITMDNLLPDENYLDSPDNEDDNTGLGLNAFLNKLSGGKKLRKKVKTIMAQSKDKLKEDLNTIKK